MGSMAFATTLCPITAPGQDPGLPPFPSTRHRALGPVESQRVEWREVGGLAASSLALVPCLGGAQLAKAAHLPLGHRLSLQLIRIPGRELQPGLCHLARVTQVTRCEKALSFIHRSAGCRGASLSSSCPAPDPLVPVSRPRSDASADALPPGSLPPSSPGIQSPAASGPSGQQCVF